MIYLFDGLVSPFATRRKQQHCQSHLAIFQQLLIALLVNCSLKWKNLILKTCNISFVKTSLSLEFTTIDLIHDQPQGSPNINQMGFLSEELFTVKPSALTC